MIKCVVLFTLLTTVFAAPGNILGGGHYAGAQVAVAQPIVASPSGVSHQSRHDVIQPGVLTYSTAHTIPVVAHAPATIAVQHTPVVRPSSAVTHESRHTIGTAVAVIGHGGYGAGAGNGNGYGGYGLGGGNGFGGAVSLGVGNGLAGGIGGVGISNGGANAHYGTAY